MNETLGSVYTETIERLRDGLSAFLRHRNLQMQALEESGSVKTLPYEDGQDLEARLKRMAEAAAVTRRCNALVQEECAAVGALLSFLQQFEEDDVFSTGNF